MNLKKCEKCQKYTLKEICPKCKNKTKEAHYKFLKIRNAQKSNPENFKK